jgi:hypothetical protein
MEDSAKLICLFVLLLSKKADIRLLGGGSSKHLDEKGD